MIFVDTGTCFACFVPKVHRHEQAAAWYLANTERLLTSDYILAELFTLLKARGEFPTALAIGAHLWSGTLAQVEYVSARDLAKAWETHRSIVTRIGASRIVSAEPSCSGSTLARPLPSTMTFGNSAPSRLSPSAIEHVRAWRPAAVGPTMNTP